MYSEITTLIVHHSQDMDGLFSGIIANQVFNEQDNCKFLSFDYYNDESIIDQFIKDNLSSDVKPHVIFIDVTPSVEWFKDHVNTYKITIIDHHFAKLNEIFKGVYGDNNQLIEAIEPLEVEYMRDNAFNFSIIYSPNSATKTLEMLSELSVSTKRDLGLNHCVKISSLMRAKQFQELINYVDYYDVWKWENVVIFEQKLMNDSQYNLYELANGIKDFKDNYSTNMINAINAYMLNYCLNKTFKKTREIDLDLLDKIGIIDTDIFDEDDRLFYSANPEKYPTELMIEFIHNQLISPMDDRYLSNINELISKGYDEYIKDYNEVKNFFETHPDVDSIVQEINHKGLHYVIVNYKFSNVIRDYFYNNYVGLNFIVLPRFEGKYFKVTGRTIAQNSFNVGDLMKVKYNGGGHFNAGGGSIDVEKVDIETLNHAEIINEYIDEYVK